MENQYSLNLFKLKINKPFDIFVYNVEIEPKPLNKPQFYQIIGKLARDLTSELKTPVISDKQQIKVVSNEPLKDNLIQKVKLVSLGIFTMNLSLSETKKMTISDFDELKHIINRLIDLALTQFSEEKYKFHVDLPYILKDDPVFDENLIKSIGIIDAKKYFRSVKLFNNEPHVLLNRETQLKSYLNLLEELKCLANKFQKSRSSEFNFYDPPIEFKKYINYIFRGKTAYVLRYPGPSIRIESITWDYKCSDRIDQQSESSCKYIKRAYGIQIKDLNQPLVTFKNRDSDETKFHIPELLALGHDFLDLKKRIPSSQRPQVWDYIHPECQNQLSEIYKQIYEFDEIMKSKLNNFSPQFIEIVPEPLRIDSELINNLSIQIKFYNKTLTLEAPYWENFYRKFSKSIKFYERIDRDLNVLIHNETNQEDYSEFLDKLNEEFVRRNDFKLNFEYSQGKLKELAAANYDLIITVSDEDEQFYDYCKMEFQNKLGIIHQNIQSKNIQNDSIIPLVLQIMTKIGKNPWSIENEEDLVTFGIYYYKNPMLKKFFYVFNIFNEKNHLIYQSEPYNPQSVLKFIESLKNYIKNYQKCLILIGFEEQNLTDNLLEQLRNLNNLQYFVIRVINYDHLRIFKTWNPPKTKPRRMGTNVIIPPIEAFPNAPQGISFRFDDNCYYLLTSRSIRKKDNYRGCPLPIRLDFLKINGFFNINVVLKYIMGLAFSNKIGGFESRLPSPLYYLKKYANYLSKYGYPTNENIKSKPYYL